MTFEVRVTRRAARNLEDLAAWLAQEGGPLVAERWLDSIEAELSRLVDFPQRHALAPEDRDVRGPEIRHVVLGNYRILFVVRDALVFVLHVRHASRLPARPGEIHGSLEDLPDPQR